MATLLGAAEIREIASRIGVNPTKKLGQNFVVDANTCRRIVKIADLNSDDVALEIGPGLGSLPKKPGQVPAWKKKKLVNPVPASPAMESKLPQGTNNTDPNGSIRR